MSSAETRLPSGFLRAALAASIILAFSGAAAHAQTVLLRGVPAGSTVELAVNAATVGKATADAAGDATVPMNLSEATGKSEIDATIHLDICGDLRRVVIVERGSPALPAGTDCERRDAPGLYLVRRISTIVVNATSAVPSVLLVQGSFDPNAPVSARAAGGPTGLVLFAGAGLTRERDAEGRACGNVSDCEGDSVGGSYLLGAEFWLFRFLAAEGTFTKPGDVTADGTGEGYRFNSFFDANVITVGGKAGAPFGSARLYGRGGASYHSATFGTTQINEDRTVTTDGVSQTLPGGTQTFEMKTTGWGWFAGGGLEVWIRPSIAVFGDFSLIRLRGNATSGAPGSLNDQVMSVFLGGKVRIGG
jgi:hypothetical protein